MDGLLIREADIGDLPAVLALYTHLHDNGMPAPSDELDALWRRMVHDPDHHLIMGVVDAVPVTACVALVVPNLTRGQRPYMLIENVVTHPTCRGRGYATALLGRAGEIAQREKCYKIMLMTGAKDNKTLDFYRRAGFDDREKTAFIRRFDK